MAAFVGCYTFGITCFIHYIYSCTEYCCRRAYQQGGHACRASLLLALIVLPLVVSIYKCSLEG